MERANIRTISVTKLEEHTNNGHFASRESVACHVGKRWTGATENLFLETSSSEHKLSRIALILKIAYQVLALKDFHDTVHEIKTFRS